MEELKRQEGEECPTSDFESGKPSGKCWGDGHYMCENCKHFRQDFIGTEGVEKRDRLLSGQGAIHISTLEEVLQLKNYYNGKD